MMSQKTTINYAVVAAQAEQRILDLLEIALRDELVVERSKVDLRTTAQPHQGQDSSG